MDRNRKVVQQWGKDTSKTFHPAISFPVSFTSACYMAVCSTERPDKGIDGWNYVSDITKTGMTIHIDADSQYYGYWLAIGK